MKNSVIFKTMERQWNIMIAGFYPIQLFPEYMAFSLFTNVIFQDCYRVGSIRPTTTFYKLALRRATKMAACATFAVVICWLPCQAYALAAQLGHAPTETVLHQVLNLLAFFNSCLNPALYAFSNGLFRKKFSEIFARLSCHDVQANDLPSTLV